MFFIVGIIVAVVFFFIFLNVKKMKRAQEATMTLIISIGALLFALVQIFTVIPAGTVGVVDLFGNVSDNTLRPGVNIVNPLAKVVKYSYKTQTIKESMSVVSKEGLPVQLEVNLQFRMDPAKANEIYKTVQDGDYINVILTPQFRSVARAVAARYEAKALYTELRGQLADEILEQTQQGVGERGITVEDVPLRQIVLPPGLARAIEEKLEADQASQRMSFVLQKEAQEAERKRIEAKGIADFQSIVSKEINANLLKWKGIEATEKLASSPNAKIVVIGSGKDGLPLILGGNN